ncbi:MAG: SOS response-associated peptidase [Myxococcaceae bacterium]|nr:SOS response-associated peptidase [Myxococcaceae bacterium]
MCGRYTLKAKGIDLQRELRLDHEPVLEPRYNLAPTQGAPVVLDTSPRELVIARWGFTPAWSRDVKDGARHINARAESLGEKRLFKDALAHRRCLVPCDGFYEWQHHGKQSTPHYVTSPEQPLLTMAGLWTPWRSPDGLEVVTFTIVTTAADAFMSRLHTRMPLFVPRDAREAWLATTTSTATISALLHGAPPPHLTAWAVGAHVNHVAFDDPRCLEKAAAVQLDLL